MLDLVSSCWMFSFSSLSREVSLPCAKIVSFKFSSGTTGVFENSEDESSEIFRGRDFQEIIVFELPLLTELSIG